MSKRQPVKRKVPVVEPHIIGPVTPKKIEKNSDSVFLEITPISEPESTKIVETQKKKSESLNISETSEAVYDYSPAISKSALPPPEYLRKATKSSIDDESIVSARKPSIMGSIKSSRATLREYGTRRRNPTFERNGTLSRLHLERVTFERKIETDEVSKLKEQLKNKDNEIERLKNELQALNAGKPVKKCTADDYKIAFLMNQELLKYSREPTKLEEFELLNQLNHLFIESKKDDFPEMLAEAYNKTISSLYSTFKTTIYKNLLLNAQLKELGLCLPDTLIEETEFKKFVELFETLKLDEGRRIKPSGILPNTKDIEMKLKEQIATIDCQKWEREAVAKDIETAYHSKFLSIIDYLIDKKKQEIRSDVERSLKKETTNIAEDIEKEAASDLFEPPYSLVVTPKPSFTDNIEEVSIASRLQLAVDDSKISLEKPELGLFEPFGLDLDFNSITF